MGMNLYIKCLSFSSVNLNDFSCSFLVVIFIANVRVVGLTTTSTWTQKVLKIRPFFCVWFYKVRDVGSLEMSTESTTSTTHTPITYALLYLEFFGITQMTFIIFSHQRAWKLIKVPPWKKNEMRARRMRILLEGGMRWRDSVRLAEDLPLSENVNVRSLPREYLNSGFSLSVDDEEKFMIFYIKSGEGWKVEWVRALKFVTIINICVFYLFTWNLRKKRKMTHKKYFFNRRNETLK